MLQALVSGILLGGVYGLFSMGFSLAFGVMRVVNFAHGEMVMLGMYLALFAFLGLHIDPLFMVLVAPIVIGALGAIVYLAVYRRYIGRTTLQQVLAAIAIGLMLQSLSQLAFSPETRSLHLPWAGQYLVVGTVFASYAQIAAFAVALVCVGAVELLLHRTRWGKSVRAVADDAEAAAVNGINSHWINVTAFALSTGLAGAAGAVLVTFYPVNPQIGFSLMPVALIATILGGLGSVGGAFIGGLLCGIIEQTASFFGSAALQDIPLYVLLLLLLAWRPFGLFGRKAAH
jgi:branched-chain amino acid transport system permease protein